MASLPTTAVVADAALSSHSNAFNAFYVATWHSFIEHDDPRMISVDLRWELESAYDVHSSSPKCLQALLKSLLLWAELAQQQRGCVAWNGEKNARLGQNLVQHLLDMKAEVNGVNTDDIYAALQAEQHPFLKKMHEALQVRKTGEGEWCRRSEHPALEPRRSATHAISPAPLRDESSVVPRRAPTVMVESLAREESTFAPAASAAVDLSRRPRDSAEAAQPSEAKEGSPQPVERAAAALPERQLRATAPAWEKPPKVSEPIAAAAVAPLPPRDSAEPPPPPPPPPSFAESVKEGQHKLPGAAPPPHGRVPVAAAAKQPAPAAHETAAGQPAHRPPPAAPVKVPVRAADPAPDALPPPSKAKATPQPAASAPKPAPAKKAVAAAPPQPAAKAPVPYVPVKKQYTYSDSEDTLSSHSTEEAAVASKAAGEPAAASASEPATPPAQHKVPVALADEAALAKFGEGGDEDLMQAFWNDLPADPDGVTAWFQRRLAVTAADRKSELRVQQVAPLSLDKLKSRMEPRVAKRLDRLFQYVSAEASAELPPHHEAAALLSNADIEKLSGAGLIRQSKKATGPDTVVAFSVLDKSEREPSRRFLSWPRGSNLRTIDDGYEPHVPLHHISSYLDAVNAPAGCVDALSAGFDQISLPPEVQERFVFTDAASRRWCLTRLPMGHTAAIEILQILLSTLCGHPSYTLQSFAAAGAVRADVWVRTVRYYGPAKDVKESREKFHQACKECGAVLESASANSLGAPYNFVGVHYDHTAHKVSVDPEMLRRIEAPQQSVSTRHLERQYTQLLFCASVLRVAASRFYTLLRTVSKRLSRALERPELLQKRELLRAEAFAQLEKWSALVRENAPRPVVAASLPNMSLFVELEEEKWSAVLIGEETQETWNAEGSLEDMLGTKVACASITSAVECFQPCIEKGAHVVIRVVGGNALGRNDKPIHRNEPKDLIADCIRTHLVTRAFSFEVEYVGILEGRGGGGPHATSPQMISKAKKR